MGGNPWTLKPHLQYSVMSLGQVTNGFLYFLLHLRILFQRERMSPHHEWCRTTCLMIKDMTFISPCRTSLITFPQTAHPYPVVVLTLPGIENNLLLLVSCPFSIMNISLTREGILSTLSNVTQQILFWTTITTTTKRYENTMLKNHPPYYLHELQGQTTSVSKQTN